MKGNFLRPKIRFLSVAGKERESERVVWCSSNPCGFLQLSAITTINTKFVFMGGTRTFSPSVTRLTLELSRNNTSGSSQINRTGGGGPSLSVRISTKSKASSERSSHSELSLATDGPSCIFVGPIETASRETLEALYRQARDAYYSGKPLIVDDMFDKIELKLRWYGSKSVVKYPRCSLRRHSTYADAEEDPSQVLALAGVWVLLLSFMSLALFLPTIHTVGLAYRDVLNSRLFSSGIESSFESHEVVHNIILIAIGSVIGYPVASAAVGALQRLWRNDLVALKGPCPNCGEEVFAFVRADLSNRASHRADCHVCESSLEFRTTVEEKDAISSLHLKIEGTKQAISRSSKRWVYGRIYLLKQRRKSLRQRWM